VELLVSKWIPRNLTAKGVVSDRFISRITLKEALQISGTNAPVVALRGGRPRSMNRPYGALAPEDRSETGIVSANMGPGDNYESGPSPADRPMKKAGWALSAIEESEALPCGPGGRSLTSVGRTGVSSLDRCRAGREIVLQSYGPLWARGPEREDDGVASPGPGLAGAFRAGFPALSA